MTDQELKPDLEKCRNCECHSWRAAIEKENTICRCGCKKEKMIEGPQLTAKEIIEKERKLSNELQQTIQQFLEPFIRQLIHIVEKNNGKS